MEVSFMTAAAAVKLEGSAWVTVDDQLVVEKLTNVHPRTKSYGKNC